MSTIGSWPTAAPVSITHHRHVWLLRQLGRFAIATLSAGACSAPCAISTWAGAVPGVEQPVRWWRDEARRGIAQLEEFLSN